MTWRDDYFPLPARHVTWCAHCPNDIEPGDAIVKRPGESQWSHHRCALEADDAEADPEGRELGRELRHHAGFRRRVRRDHVRRRRAAVGMRLKRKQRVRPDSDRTVAR